MMVIFNKLVRDKIPQIIEGNGEICEFAVLDPETFAVELRKKLQEEVTEYLTSTNDENAIEELADILEVVHSLAKTHHVSMADIEKIRRKKLEVRGGFDRKYFLISKK